MSNFVQVHGLERTAAAMLASLMLVAWAVVAASIGLASVEVQHECVGGG